jgi:uncharacterized protein YyaL (SSP411 family)
LVNRLAASTSPYLLQHAQNPVDWWEWSPQAFAEARRRDAPVLLSVGYSACHWCHVMAHESFEDVPTATQMNADFVCIKVDREERPDVDAIYMDATQALTGQGGWPMTCFLTPAGDPFYCGTYYPKQPSHGMPAFRQVLEAVAVAWRDRRAELTATGAEVVRLLGERSIVSHDGSAPDADVLEQAVSGLRRDYDATSGGFGSAPKFPPSAVLEFLLRQASLGAMEMVAGTCTAMARGGIYDQLAGGFARYSVDAAWVVPHFEKMLYDNAQLVRVYAHWWRSSGDPLARRIALETAEFMMSGLGTAEGGFASALDADAAGVEGSTYVWTPAELHEALGADDASWFGDLTVVTPKGTFEHGASVLQRPEEPDDADRWERVRAKLLAERARRPQPGRDDKVVSAWNGLAVAGLAETGAIFERPDLIDAAVAAAELLLDVHLVDGRLRRASRDGAVGEPAGVLEDYACVADGLLALAQVIGSSRYLAAAGALLDVVLAHFTDGAGGFFDAADDAEALVRRPQSVTDDATPSGTSAAAHALLTYSALTGSIPHRDAATGALGSSTTIARQFPRAAGWGLATAAAVLAGPVEIAIVGDAVAVASLERAARLSSASGAVVAVGSGGSGAEPWAPLLRGRPATESGAAAYVCRGFVCERPVTTVEELRALLLGER